MNKPAILTTQSLSKTYQQGKIAVSVLSDINLTVHAQETISIVGSSGSGKSTLLQLLGGLDSPTSGKVLLDGHDLSMVNDQEKSRLRNEKLGFVYQFHHLLPEFTALENVAMPLFIRGMPKKNAEEKALHMIERVGLSARSTHRPSELSGGERQRIAIARAMVTEPACLLADEPTGNLDQHNAHAILDLMLKLNQENQTALIIVTHDNDIAQKTQKTYHLLNGRFDKV